MAVSAAQQDLLGVLKSAGCSLLKFMMCCFQLFPVVSSVSDIKHDTGKESKV